MKRKTKSRTTSLATDGSVLVRASSTGLGPFPSAEGPRIRNAEELIADRKLKLPKELVRGIFHRGTRGVLAGPSKSGKSWAALDLGMSIATGTPWLKWNTTKGRVLYLNYEIMEAAFAQRVLQVKAAKTDELGELDFSDFDIVTMRGFTEPFQTAISKLLANSEGPRYSLIVIDPLYKAIGGGKQNSAAAVEQMCRWLNKLSKSTEMAVLVVHHFTKGKQTNKPLLARFGGSVVITQDADTIIGLTEYPGEENCFTMEFELRNFPEQKALVVERKLPQFFIREDLDPNFLSELATKKQGRSTGLLDLLDGDGLTTMEWEELAKSQHDIPRATFYRDKKELIEAGKAEQDKKTKLWRKAG